jgi:DNA-binding GntR family transcriptional regulator
MAELHFTGPTGPCANHPATPGRYCIHSHGITAPALPTSRSLYTLASVRASDRAYKTLHEDIVEWRLLPGTVLAEVEQSERLGVSRTPLREALGRLSAEGLTQSAGGRGVVVTDISLENVDELFELREILECRAAALAAQRGDASVFTKLHALLLSAPDLINDNDPRRHEYYALVGRLDEAIDVAVSNSYLAQAMRSLRVHLVRVRRLASDDATRLAAAAAEHAAIAEAIAAGNPRLAEAATTLHLHRSLTHLKATHTPQ